MAVNPQMRTDVFNPRLGVIEVGDRRISCDLGRYDAAGADSCAARAEKWLPKLERSMRRAGQPQA
jgi:hypothetical protein